MKKFYITTAIPYANAKPHIGTAMDYLYGDILLRYHSSRSRASAPGQDAEKSGALMSIGTDEHGTKVEKKAQELSKTPQQLVDDLQNDFEEMRIKLNLDFANIVNVRTTDSGHIKRVQEIWRRLDAAGVIYKDTYEGWYCVGCESFVTETEARDMDYTCADHQKPLEKLSEENYYLKVSQFTEQIREFVKTSVVPEFRGKEILELIKDGAKDVSISRPVEKLKWGVEVPNDSSQVMYVWIDALSNYLTVIGYPEENSNVIPSAAEESRKILRQAQDDKAEMNWRDYWPADVEIVGKDILRFHAIIWPAMLLALGLDLPKKLLVHGFVNVAGSKMSKSIGNVVSPLEIIEQYGADAFRYYFARHIPTFDDGDFTWEKFENAYNGELANDLGNLVSRVANMLKKYCDGRLDFEPFGTNTGSDIEEKIIARRKLMRLSFENVDSRMQGLRLTSAVDHIFEVVQLLNETVESTKPWVLAKNPGDSDDLMQVLCFLVDGLRALASGLESSSPNSTPPLSGLVPFLPETADKIREIFGGEKLPDEIPILFPKKYLHTEEPSRK